MGWRSLVVRPASLVSGVKAIAPQLFYFSNWGANVFLQPYLAVLWRSLGFSGAQIGVLSFIRPMVAAPSGQLLAATADARQLHLPVLLSAFAAVVLCRSAMALASAFTVHALLVLISEAGNAPVVVLADASVAAAAPNDAAFGRRRLFASIGWGGLAPLTGWVVGRFGVRCNIYFYMAFALLAALPICLLPVDALGAKKVKSGGRPSLSEEEEEESGKAQIEDSASSRGIRSSSAVPGATPRRAQQAVRKQMKTRSALPLLAAGKGSERSNAWGGGSTEHGSQGSKDNSGVQSSGEGEAAGQWDLEAGHHVEEGSGSPKDLHSHGGNLGLTFPPHWGPHQIELAAKWTIPAGREHLDAESAAEAGAAGPAAPQPAASLAAVSKASTASQAGGLPAQLPFQLSLPAATGANRADEEEHMHSPFHTAAAATCPFVQEQEYSGAAVATQASRLASQGPLPSIDPAGLPEAIGAAPCWEAQQLELGVSSGRLTSVRAEGERAAGGEQRAAEQQTAEQQGMDSCDSIVEAAELSPWAAAGGFYGSQLKPLLVPKRKHHNSSSTTQPESDSRSMGDTPPQRLHSVTVALLSRYQPVGARSSEAAPGGMPRHRAARTLSMLGAHSARALRGMRHSLHSFLAAGDVADIGLPEAASPHASLHSSQRLRLAFGRARPVGRGLLDSMIHTPGPAVAETAPAAISAAERFAVLLEAIGDSGAGRDGEPGFTAGTPEGATPAGSRTALQEQALGSRAGSRYSLQQPGSARASAAGISELSLNASNGPHIKQGGSSSQGGISGTLELDLPIVIRSPTARPFSPTGGGSGGSGSPVKELRRRASSRQVASPHTLEGLSAAGRLQQGELEEGRAVHAPTSAAPATVGGVWTGVKQLLWDPRQAAFFARVLLFGFATGCVNYLMLYLKELGAPGMLLGLCMSANCLGEVLVFYFSGWWLARLGVERALNLAAAAYALRLGAYTLLPLAGSLWWVLGVELLQGLTFAGMLSAATAHCKRSAAPHLRSTTQAIFGSLFFGVGPAISGLAGGYIYQAAGLRTVFVVGLGVMAAGWTTVALGLRLAVRGGRAPAASQPGLV